ncbi:MAG: DUF2723 domain-containing protein, partial [Candidatus Kapaibacterium sp.]
PHPTGYPLLMILGHVATILIPGRDIVVLNILAALLAGGGAGVWHSSSLEFLGDIPRLKEGQKEVEPRGGQMKTLGEFLLSRPRLPFSLQQQRFGGEWELASKHMLFTHCSFRW